MPSTRIFLAVVWLVLMWTASRFFAAATPANETLTIGYSSFSGQYVPLWIAVEDRLARKYGLDLKERSMPVELARSSC